MNTTFHPQTADAYRLLHKGVLALAKAERQGMRIDIEYCKDTIQRLEREVNDLEEEFYGTDFYKHWRKTVVAVPNIHSGKQLGDFLYGVKKLKPPKETPSGLGSTDDDSLTQLNIPELNMLLKVRKLKKAKDTYLVPFIREQVDGYVHPFFNLHLARTFRSSSDKPNFQNIPKREEEEMLIVRRALFPRPGNQLMEIDYNQLEVSIAACYHKDPTMLEYIRTLGDLHADMTKVIFKLKKFEKTPEHKVLRAAVKNGFVFPQFYGDWHKPCALSIAGHWGGLSDKRKWKPKEGIFIEKGLHLSDHMAEVGISSMKQFIDHMQEIERHFWEDRFPVYARWKEKHWKRYIKTGYVDLHTGFRCQGIMSRNDAINYPVQGAAFHCLLWAFIQITDWLETNGYSTKCIGQIHDAIILDVPPKELPTIVLKVQEIMCEGIKATMPWIIVPLRVEADVGEVDASWADLAPYKIN